jgi:hypothetical protein
MRLTAFLWNEFAPSRPAAARRDKFGPTPELIFKMAAMMCVEGETLNGKYKLQRQGYIEYVPRGSNHARYDSHNTIFSSVVTLRRLLMSFLYLISITVSRRAKSGDCDVFVLLGTLMWDNFLNKTTTTGMYEERLYT